MTDTPRAFSTASLVELSDYRARVAELYANVRRSDDPDETTWLRWHEAHHELMATHPQSAFVSEELSLIHI